MTQNSLRVSETGQKKIKQAIAHHRDEWKVKLDDARPIVAANKDFIARYAETHQLQDNDPQWLQDFKHLFRVETSNEPQSRKTANHQVNQIQQQIEKTYRQNPEQTYLKSITEQIDREQLFVKGISYGTWSKFASQSKRHSINSRAFKAYCNILGLDWKDIAETDYDPNICDCGLDEPIAHRSFKRLKDIHHNLYDLLTIESVEKHLNRQISQLLVVAEKHGGKDWKEWQDYQQLEDKWSVICEAIEWCMEQDRYHDVKVFWHYVKCYSYIQGYQGDRQREWNNQLHWTQWLIDTAKMYEDWSMAAQGIFDLAWTFTLIGTCEHLEQAYALFQEAKTLERHTDLIFQIDLAIHFAFLLLRRQQYSAAQDSLKEAETLLNSHQLEQQVVQRCLFQIRYYQGQISFYTKEYPLAKQYFTQALNRAETLNWQRAIALCTNWLGNVAVNQGDCQTAEGFLQDVLTIARENKDSSRMAFGYQSLAYFFKKQNNGVKAKEHGTKAVQLFEKLGLLREAQVTKKNIALD